jgi:hypothetical protein
VSDGKGGAVTKLCPTGLCCSQYGYCGDTEDHCDVSKGCQAGESVAVKGASGTTLTGAQAGSLSASAIASIRLGDNLKWTYLDSLFSCGATVTVTRRRQRTESARGFPTGSSPLMAPVTMLK